MTKSITASTETKLHDALEGFKARASEVKEAHRVARKEIQDDVMISDLAKEQKLDALSASTRAQLDSIRGNQDSYVASLKNELEAKLRGQQPTDANSILLRRDASDRVRSLRDAYEAEAILADAIANGDTTLAHAVGARARNIGMTTVAAAYREAFPETADVAEALAGVESNTSGGPYNLVNQITYSAPM